MQQELVHNLKCSYSDQDDLDGSVVPVSDQGDLMDSVAVLDAEKSYNDVVELPSGEEVAMECCDSE